MSKKYSLKTNAIFNALYQILLLIVPLITTPYVSRVLGPSQNGVYANLFSVSQYFILVATFGLVEYGTIQIAKNRDNLKNKTKYFVSVFGTKLILGIGSALLYIVTCYFLYDYNTFLLSLIFSLLIITTAIDPIFYFQGEERFINICIKNMILKILTTVFIFIFVKKQEDLYIYALILSIGQLLSTVILIPSIKFKEFVKVEINFNDFFECFKNSFAFFVPSLAVTLFTYLNQTLIGAMNPNINQSGYFAQAVKIIQILAIVASSLSTIMLSRISYLNAINDEEEIQRKIKKTFQAFWVISIPLILGVIVIASNFIPLFLGEGYDECVILIYVLSPTIILGPLNGFYGSLYYRPKNKIRIQTFIILGSAVLNLIVSILLIPQYGALGTAIGRLIAEFCQLPFLIYFSRNYIKTKDLVFSSIKPITSGVIMFICVLLFKLYGATLVNNEIVSLLLMIMIGAVVYGALELTLKDDIVYSNFKLVTRKLFKIK